MSGPRSAVKWPRSSRETDRRRAATAVVIPRRRRGAGQRCRHRPAAAEIWKLRSGQSQGVAVDMRHAVVECRSNVICASTASRRRRPGTPSPVSTRPAMRASCGCTRLHVTTETANCGHPPGRRRGCGVVRVEPVVDAGRRRRAPRQGPRDQGVRDQGEDHATYYDHIRAAWRIAPTSPWTTARIWSGPPHDRLNRLDDLAPPVRRVGGDLSGADRKALAPAWWARPRRPRPGVIRLKAMAPTACCSIPVSP